MTNETINAKVYKIKKLEMEKKAIEEELNKIKGCLKDAMKAEGVNEFKTDKFIVRNTPITSHRFDTKKFKVDHAALYEAYQVESTSERFSIK